MSRVICGIDIGSHSVKVVLAQAQHKAPPSLLASASVNTHGLKDGYIVNGRDVARSLKKAIAQVQKESGIEIDSAFVAIGGVGLSSKRVFVDLTKTGADSKVKEEDIKKLLEKAKAKISKDLNNRVVLHEIPIKYYINKEEILGSPVDYTASKIGAEFLFVYVLEPHFNNVHRVLDELEIEVQDTMASPIAASLVTLSEEQKEVGVALANIGAETVSLIVFEDSVPISVQVFPVGSSDITNDIALKLQVPLKEAEDMKVGRLRSSEIPQKKVEEIISSRLKEIFSIIKSHLKEIGRDGLLPAGVVLTGGGVGLANVKDLARVALKLPSELASLKVPNSTIKDSTWAVAYGLCIYGAGKSKEKKIKATKLKQALGNLLKHFMP